MWVHEPEYSDKENRGRPSSFHFSTLALSVVVRRAFPLRSLARRLDSDRFPLLLQVIANKKRLNFKRSSRFIAGWNYERGSSDRNVDTDLTIGGDVKQEEPTAEQPPD